MMALRCIRLLWVLDLVAAQDLFFAQHGSAREATNLNGTLAHHGHFFKSCDDQAGGDWPTFHNQGALQHDHKWRVYFSHVYGGVPSFGYPICISGFRVLDMDALHSAGIQPPVAAGTSAFRGTPGGFFTSHTFASDTSIGYIKHNYCSDQCFGSNVWVEGIHCQAPLESRSAWYFFATGSGVWIFSGKTQAWLDRNAFNSFMGYNRTAGNPFGTVFQDAHHQHGLDTVQFTHPIITEGGGNPMFIHTTGVGSYTCGGENTPFKAGWAAQDTCNCDSSKQCQNCHGYSSPGCAKSGEVVVV